MLACRQRGQGWCVTAALVVAWLGGACAGPQVVQEPSPGSDPSVVDARDDDQGPAPEAPTASWAPMEELPAREADEPDRRPRPQVRSVEDAQRAIAAGFYEEAGSYLEGLGSPAPAARLALARLALITGRYSEAEAHARAAAKDAGLRAVALTLAGESLAARGQLAEAEVTLRAVADASAAHRARVLLGRVLERQGKPEARSWFYKLVAAYNDDTISLRDGEGLAYVGMAAWALGAARDANEAFQQATRADAERVETQIEWARLFLEKYDTGHAEESVRHALGRNPNHPEARELLARIRIAQSYDFKGAEAQIERALGVNPNLVRAHVTLAGMALRDGDEALTDRHLARALSVDTHDLEARSLRAAVALIHGDRRRFAQAEGQVLARHSTFARMYTIIADYADWEHRYAEIVELARKAVRLDPSDGVAHATLGLNLMRTGAEEEGLGALREAWRRDRFNVQVYNTLNLYDDVIPKEYEDLGRGPFVFRMHREERAILERYVPALLEGAHRAMVRRYGFTPEGPVRIELYGHPEHFAVRTTGLPRLGVQGVCFGKVITALSPRGGPFNWGQITWHELAHVFHLQLSRNRVPRWFTEGLAEHETMVARPEWKREMDHTLWLALEGGRVPPVALMNRAFTHAESAEDMMTAYYASSRVVQYVVERFGMPKVVQMLRAWGRGQATPQVVREVLGVDLDTLDRDFRAHIRRALEPRARDFTVDFARFTEIEPLQRAAEGRPDDAEAQAAFAAGLLVAGRRDEGLARAERAVALAPRQPTARFVLARMALAGGDRRAAAGHLRQLLAGGVDGYEVRRLLARALTEGADTAAVRTELEAAARIDPERPEAWMGLMALASKQKDASLRLRALERLAQIDEHGRATVRSLLPLLAEKGRHADLVTYGEMALLVDPLHAGTHRWLAEGYLHSGQPKKALFELDSALLAAPEQPGPIHLARARALVALGRRGEAQRAADAAVAADPSLADEARQALRR
jgi:cellulose synthase operon protein C